MGSGLVCHFQEFTVVECLAIMNYVNEVVVEGVVNMLLRGLVPMAPSTQGRITLFRGSTKAIHVRQHHGEDLVT
jgi:hypothetical protein